MDAAAATLFGVSEGKRDAFVVEGGDFPACLRHPGGVMQCHCDESGLRSMRTQAELVGKWESPKSAMRKTRM
jgi:hypothetical protein